MLKCGGWDLNPSYAGDVSRKSPLFSMDRHSASTASTQLHRGNNWGKSLAAVQTIALQTESTGMKEMSVWVFS